MIASGRRPDARRAGRVPPGEQRPQAPPHQQRGAEPAEQHRGRADVPDDPVQRVFGVSPPGIDGQVPAAAAGRPGRTPWLVPAHGLEVGPGREGDQRGQDQHAAPDQAATASGACPQPPGPGAQAGSRSSSTLIKVSAASQAAISSISSGVGRASA